ncbi:MAG: MoaD/ThiS family protein [Anaerolineae bacterium]|nr:MoaD/ThiS family protein [Anaerolineae bacterium]
MIQVRIYGPLWDHLGSSMEMEPDGQGIRVADLLARLEIDVGEVGIVTVDGRQSRPDDTIGEDSRVCIFPPMFGG